MPATCTSASACRPIQSGCRQPYRKRESLLKPQPARRLAPAPLPAAAAEPAATAATRTPLFEQLDTAGKEQWAACRDLLQEELGLEASAADTVLAEACGWRGQGYWRRERVKLTPDPAAISANLEYLRGLGLGSEDLASMLGEQPQLLGLPQELMAENVAHLEQRFFIKGKYLAGALKRKPRMLGNLIDCSEDGSCQGLCTRCWAQC